MMVVRPLLTYVPSLFVFLVAAQSPLLLAQYQKYEGKTVTAIQFSPSTQPIGQAELLKLIPLKTGQPLRMADVRASIDRMFAIGRYADIQVEAEPSGNGVALTFHTKNSWFIGNVSVAGDLSSPPNRGQLANATRLDLGQPYTDAKLQTALQGQKALFDNNGLFHSQIHPVFDYDPKYQQVNLKFEVDSGDRARLTEPVLTGDLKMDADKIVSATNWRRWLVHTWKPMTASRVQQGLEGIRKLYQKDDRLEAKVALESIHYDPEANRAQPTLNIDAGPRIEVNTIGAKVSRKKLQRLVPIYEEHAVDHDLLVEGARRLEDYFQSEGYYEAQVAFKQQRVTNDKASIDYLVNRGKRHKLVYIGISGNKYFTRDAIRERMYLQPASLLQFRHGRYSESFLRRDEQSIIDLYQSNGFRDVQVTHEIKDDYQGKIGHIAVFLKIDEGPQYFINKLQVDGIEKLNKATILGLLSSTEGQPFSEFSVAVDRDTILAQYFNSGFPDATFEWNYQPAAEPHRIDLHYIIREGTQQFVRDVLISGLNITRPSLVRRNLSVAAGDPLSPTALTQTQRNLYDLGIFATVNVAVQNPDGDYNRKYVLYEMEEARRYSMAVGVGAELGRIGGCTNCLDAATGQTGFSPRVSFDITRNNMWGLGHSLSLRTRASTLEQRGLLTYTWPRFRDSPDLTVSFTGLFEQSRDIRTFSYQRAEGSAQLSQRLTKATTMFYRFAYRRVSVNQSTLKITPFLIPLLSQPVRVGILSINMVQDRRDDSIDPHKGVYNTVDLGLAERIFGSQRNFLHFLGRNATYHPIGKKLVLARSTEFGDIWAFNFNGDPLDAIPLAERFFGGGGTSHRGFPENQAGPRDLATGFPLGGTALLFNQVELRFPLIGENIGGVLFHDAGNIYTSVGHMTLRQSQPSLQDFDYMVHAVGFGIRYRTPIGPVRLDLAYSINPPRFFGFKGTQQELIDAGVTPCSPPPGVANQCVEQSVSHFQFFFSIGQTF
ncbi:MAG TPA: outer membrane protein assembly factor BamA [Bryobacteraceae bacterium]|nr:outer membrane protein assembly factor BamA [Bryobacteraceae bacterium]